MKQAIITIILFIAILLPVERANAVQQVVDATNLIQNIEQTLRTIHIEHASLVAMAQRAQSIGQKAQMVVNLQNQLLAARKNLMNLRIMIQSGKYKSINDLNAICFQVQRIGFSVTNIKTSFESLFPDEFKSRDHSLTITERQEKELSKMIESSMLVEAEAIENNKSTATTINDLMKKSQKAIGVKGAIQANTALLAELASQNMEIKKLLAMQSRVAGLRAGREITADKLSRYEHNQFMRRFNSKETGLMTLTLQRFTKAISFGYASMIPEALSLLRYFIIIEVFFFGVLIMYTRTQISHEAIKKVILIGFYVWLIPNIEMFSSQIMRTFAQVGTSGMLTVEELFDPSAICMIGFDAAIPIFDAAGGWSNPFDAIMLGFTGAVIVCSFIYVAWVIFMSTIEFYIVTVSAVWLMAFSVFKPLQFLAERTVAAAFALSVRFMIMALTLCGAKIIILNFAKAYKSMMLVTPVETTLAFKGTILGLLTTTTTTKIDITIWQSLELMASAATIAIIFHGASRLSSNYFGGAPALGGSALIGALKSASDNIKGAGQAMTSGAELMVAATSKHKEATNA